MKKEKLQILEADSEDLNKIIKLTNQAFSEQYLLASIYRSHGVGKFLKSSINNPCGNHQIFKLILDNKIIGAAETNAKGNIVFLNMISLDKSYRGNKYSNIFIEFLIDYFKKLGYSKFQLDVFKSNKIGLNWYSKYLFNEISFKFMYKLNKTTYDHKYHIEYEILNFPQYKTIQKKFGFSEILINSSNTKILLGQINDDIILRSSYSKNVVYIAYDLIKILGLNNFYFFSTNELDTREIPVERIETILRMELIL